MKALPIAPGFLWLLMAASTAPGQAPPVVPVAGGIEPAPELQASQFLAPAQVRGEHHRVRDLVTTDGYLAHFVIDSDFGTFECAGSRHVGETLNEIAAIAELAEVSKGDLFVNALKESAKKPVEAVGAIIDDPKGAVTAIPSTVGHFFQKVGHSLKASASAQNEEPTVERLESAGKGLLGYNKALLDCARELKVDPYTENQVLKDKLETVAWVYYAGGVPIGAGVNAISGGAYAAMKVTTYTGLPEELYDLTPSELSFQHDGVLRGMGIDEATINRFLQNPAISVAQQCRIMAAIGALASVEGREKLIALAGGIEVSQRAVFFADALELLSRRPGLVSIEVLGRLPVGRGADGGLEIAAPVDFVSWTEQVAAFANRDDLRSQSPTLAMTGGITDRAREGFEAAGWKLVPAR